MGSLALRIVVGIWKWNIYNRSNDYCEGTPRGVEFRFIFHANFEKPKIILRATTEMKSVYMYKYMYRHREVCYKMKTVYARNRKPDSGLCIVLSVFH